MRNFGTVIVVAAMAIRHSPSMLIPITREQTSLDEVERVPSVHSSVYNLSKEFWMFSSVSL